MVHRARGRRGNRSYNLLPLNPHDGYLDTGGLGHRIGEYAGVDCNGTAVYAAWTDTREGQSAIYFIRMLRSVN